MRFRTVIACALIFAAQTVFGADAIDSYDTPSLRPPQAVFDSPAESADWIDATEPVVIRAQSVTLTGLTGTAGEVLKLVTGTGLQAIGSVTNGAVSTVGSLFNSRGRVRFEYLYDNEVQRYGGHIITRTGNGLGIDAEGNFWDPTSAGVDEFWTGDVNLMLSLSTNPRMIFRSGVGTAFIYRDDADFGYNFTHGLDLYLLGPWIFSGDVDWGQIEGEDLFRYRVALGAEWLGFEWFAGWDSYKLGGDRFEGAIAGVALWY